MGMTYPMTQEGYSTLLEERKHLQKIKLPQIIKEVQIAREHGDLSENAEYKFGREAQRECERKIGDIEHKLTNAKIINVTELDGETVIFGSTVTFIDLDKNNEKITYKIVGEDEADLSKGKISYLAPIIKVAIGKEPGDEISLATAKGERNLEIDDVQYI